MTLAEACGGYNKTGVLLMRILPQLNTFSQTLDTSRVEVERQLQMVQLGVRNYQTHIV
jgi:hypothetical protein